MLHAPNAWIISQALPISIASTGGLTGHSIQQSLFGDLCCYRGPKAAMTRGLVVLSCIGAIFLPKVWTASAVSGGVYLNMTAFKTDVKAEVRVKH